MITSPPPETPEPPVPEHPAPVDHKIPEPAAIPARKQPIPTPVTQAPKPPLEVLEVRRVSHPPVGNEREHSVPPASEPPKSGLIPVILILILLAVGVGVAVRFGTRKTDNDFPPRKSVTSTADAEANYLRIGWRKEAYQVLSDFMAATTSEEKLRHVLHGSSLADTLEDFYGGGVIDDSDTPAEAFSIYELSEEDHKRGLFMMIFDQPPQFDMKEFFRPLATLEVQYGIDEADLLLSTLARAGNFSMEPIRVHAFFKRTPAGLKLDWEIFAQTKYRTFQNFVEVPDSGQTGIFRVLIVEDVPDKSHLEADIRTYRIADPANTADSARINVKVDSEIGRALSVLNWRGTKESHPTARTATIELAWTGDATSPDLEISRFICWEFLGLGGKETPSPASSK